MVTVLIICGNFSKRYVNFAFFFFTLIVELSFEISYGSFVFNARSCAAVGVLRKNRRPEQPNLVASTQRSRCGCGSTRFENIHFYTFLTVAKQTCYR